MLFHLDKAVMGKRMKKSVDMYQLEYSRLNPRILVAEGRRVKAQKIIAIIKDFLEVRQGRKLRNLTAFELGCAGGEMTKVFAEHFKKILAVDIDKRAIDTAKKYTIGNHVTFEVRDALNSSIQDESFDVVICNHVYEHVPDPVRLMHEIYRVLADSGICYFAGPNKYTLIEGHYFLPFLSWLSKPLASRYMKLVGRGTYYYETPYSYPALKHLVRHFVVHDYTLHVLIRPSYFYASHKLAAVMPHIPTSILKAFLPMMPSFFWILEKRRGR